MPVRQREVVLVMPFILFRQKQTSGTLCLRLAEQGHCEPKRAKASLRLEDEYNVRPLGVWDRALGEAFVQELHFLEQAPCTLLYTTLTQRLRRLNVNVSKSRCT